MIEEALGQIIDTGRATCFAAAHSPWLADLGLTCDLSNEVLAGVLVVPVAFLWIVSDLLITGSRARAIRKVSVLRLEARIGRDRQQAQAEWPTGAAENSQQTELGHEDTRLAAPMFGPIRVMKWV